MTGILTAGDRCRPRCAPVSCTAHLTQNSKQLISALFTDSNSLRIEQPVFGRSSGNKLETSIWLFLFFQSMLAESNMFLEHSWLNSTRLQGSSQSQGQMELLKLWRVCQTSLRGMSDSPFPLKSKSRTGETTLAEDLSLWTLCLWDPAVFFTFAFSFACLTFFSPWQWFLID